MYVIAPTNYNLSILDTRFVFLEYSGDIIIVIDHKSKTCVRHRRLIGDQSSCHLSINENDYEIDTRLDVYAFKSPKKNLRRVSKTI